MKKLSTFFKGFLMGTCDIIPGVSGGTMAFITGIYDKLVDALHACNFSTLRLLVNGKIKDARKKIDGNFLLQVFSGIFLAILSLSKVVHTGLEHYPRQIRGFFFGLILASTFLIKKQIKKINRKIVVLAIVGLGLGFLLSNLKPVNIGTANTTMLLSGSIAIIAMILPGISGSYILLILGQYSTILGHITDITKGKTASILPILFFTIGAIIGLLLFSKALHRIKKHYHDQMTGLLAGIMIGSLNKLRPRKETITQYIDKNGQAKALVTKNILPTINQDFWIIITCMIGGIIIIGTITVIAKNYQKIKKTENKENRK